MISKNRHAKSAFAVAEQVLERGAAPRGHLTAAATLPPNESVQNGPARLRFQGREHLLADTSFTLGKQPGCSLVVDGDYPGVAPRHCEICRDRVQFVLWDGQLVLTLMITVTVLHETLRIEVTGHALGPVNGLFTSKPEPKTILYAIREFAEWSKGARDALSAVRSS